MHVTRWPLYLCAWMPNNERIGSWQYFLFQLISIRRRSDKLCFFFPTQSAMCVCVSCANCVCGNSLWFVRFHRPKLIRIAFNKSHISSSLANTNNAVIQKAKLCLKEGAVLEMCLFYAQIPWSNALKVPSNPLFTSKWCENCFWTSVFCIRFDSKFYSGLYSRLDSFSFGFSGGFWPNISQLVTEHCVKIGHLNVNLWQPFKVCRKS